MKKRKPIGPPTFCNICGLPDNDHPLVKSETTTDPETGEDTTEEWEVVCLGHIGIHPSFWNLHPHFDRFAKTRARRARS